MTLSFFLTPMCFIAPVLAGILADKDAGGGGIGLGVGLIAGGLAYYALKKTVYSDELEERRKSQPQVVKALIDLVTGGWMIVFLLVAPALVASFSTKFIVQQMAG